MNDQQLTHQEQTTMTHKHTTGMGRAADANARLIAASHEMLDALVLALRVIERRMNAQGIDHTDDTEAQILRAVIRKALEG